MDQSAIKKHTGSDELSIPRARMKRELMSVLKTQAEMGEIPLVRQRVSRYQNLDMSWTDDVDYTIYDKRRLKRKVRNNVVRDNVVAVPETTDVPKESSIEAVESGVVQESDLGWSGVVQGSDLGWSGVVQESDLGWSNSECYIPKFDDEPVENVSFDILTDYQKRMIEDDDLFMSVFLPPYNFDFKPDSNEEVVHGGINDGTADDVANVSTGMEFIKVPKTLKDLLETHLFEGLRVRYVHGPKGMKTELVGFIQGTEILCSCGDCNGKAVTPTVFESHANSRNKRPSESILLDNNKSLKDILNACKDAELDSLEMLIRDAIN